MLTEVSFVCVASVCVSLMLVCVAVWDGRMYSVASEQMVQPHDTMLALRLGV